MSGIVSSLMRAAHAPIYASRLRVLVNSITPHLRENDRILDVGCGVGTLARAIQDSPRCPKGVAAEGLERHARGNEPIPVTQYDGHTIPFPDDTFDLVILADVLHHDENPDRLLSECRRVSRRYLVIKDHQVKGPLAQPRISLIDWAANAPHDVKCLYRYNTPEQWRRLPIDAHMRLVHEHAAMNLYPPLVNLLFGRALQYLAVYDVTTPPESAE